MGVPNGTAAGQETDQQSNNGTFEQSLCQNRNALFSYRQLKHHIKQALLKKKAATIKTEDCDDDAENGENYCEIVDKINPNEQEDTEEATWPDLRLVYPFAASQKKN
jgi:hypothetical protein